ncbi:hypothetical protein [Variovorax sp. W6]|uniref:hypothetical protein n=1 Tax=Variovorax sp. W6 TaxID=3093895 RepID=UPI003D805AAC
MNAGREEGAADESTEWFERARQLFTEAYRANPHAKWADEHAGHCALALQEVAAGHGADLCAQWKRVTYEALKLEKHFGPLKA